MAYVLQSLISLPGDALREEATRRGLPLVRLGGGAVMLPLTAEIVDLIAAQSPPGPGPGPGREADADADVRAHAPVMRFHHLTGAVAQLGRVLSARGDTVAYVEIEMFGGSGTHAAVAWQRGEVAHGPLFTQTHPGEGEPWYEVDPDTAVNKVLRFLGVQASDHEDEFDALGLGRHRFTPEWVADVHPIPR